MPQNLSLEIQDEISQYLSTQNLNTLEQTSRNNLDAVINYLNHIFSDSLKSMENKN
jgi:hypothetical protein